VARLLPWTALLFVACLTSGCARGPAAAPPIPRPDAPPTHVRLVVKTRPRSQVRLYYGPHPNRRPAVLIGARRTAANGSASFDDRLPVPRRPSVLYEVAVDGTPFRFFLHAGAPRQGQVLLSLPTGERARLYAVGRARLPGRPLAPLGRAGSRTTYALDRRSFYRVRLADGTPLYLRFV
jgi:hypothetical protein